jgi:hypothetical protein
MAFRRGFVEKIVVGHGHTFAGLEELFAQHVCSDVELRGDVNRLCELALSPLLERLRSCFFATTISPEQFADLRFLLEGPRLAGLRSLGWLGCADDLLDCLRARSGAANLTALEVRLTGAGLAALVGEPALAAVTSIQGQWDRAGLDTLLTHADRWRGLELWWDNTPADRVLDLTGCSRLVALRLSCSHPEGVSIRLPEHLEQLELNDNLPPSLLCRFDCLPHLRRLGCRLWLDSVSEQEWDALGELLTRLPGPVLDLDLSLAEDVAVTRRFARLPGLNRVRGLRIEEQTLTAEHLRGLAECAGLTGLRSLSLANAPLEAQHARLLASSPILCRLQELDLWGTEIGDEGVAALLGSPHLRRLTKLWLGWANLTSASAERLATWEGLPRLRHLRVDCNRIDARGARALLRAEGLSPLTHPDLDENRFGDQLTAEVQSARERLGIRLKCSRQGELGENGDDGHPD